MAGRVSDATSYSRIRSFVENHDIEGRRLTAEWLAGRLGVPLPRCCDTLEQLAADGLVRRHLRGEESPWFDVAPPSSGAGVQRVFLGALVLSFSAALVVGGAMLGHVFYFALGLGLGLMIAFAWLDWELRSRL